MTVPGRQHTSGIECDSLEDTVFLGNFLVKGRKEVKCKESSQTNNTKKSEEKET